MTKDKETFQDFSVDVDKIYDDSISANVPEYQPVMPPAENIEAKKPTKPTKPMMPSYIVRDKHASPLNNSPLSHKERRDISRGNRTIDARIDLHGKLQKQAYQDLNSFMQNAIASNKRMLLIVTGKGTGILQNAVPQWLQQFSHDVLYHTQAAPKDGGSGALYVFLRKKQ